MEVLDVRYNVRVKSYPDGSLQFLKMPRLYDTVVSPKRFTGESVERGREGNLKSTIQTVYDLAKSNAFDWFFTLTFNPDIVDSYSWDDVSKHMAKFTDVLRKRGCKYIFVPELHPMSGRFHFHGLVQGSIPMSVAHSPYTGEVMLDNHGRIIYNVDIYKYGWSTATEITDTKKASTYLCKYLSKDLGEAVPLGKKRFWASKSLSRPENDYDLVDDEQFGSVFTGARYRKSMFTPHGRFDLCEY